MYLLLTILIVIAALLMCFIVLIQNSKGGGLASGFSSSNQIMGVRKTTDFLEKATWGLAIVIVVLSIGTAYILPRSASEEGSVLMEKAKQEESINPYNMPSGVDAPIIDSNSAPVDAPAASDVEE
ncbi:MAG: preprotein translocase subunit SecG [Bacteroidales bacterium]|nr:preprotein translocase subunit SecG [Bacteroidales bacterium]